ncbi:MAG: hypothetical protein BWK75_03175 [Candidatus Altiarchaeales archaeon A3]|nr:MAG: hypothetical protein BWK75_03175 [Candidatus Altiarchaeales archaeon A3]
MGFFDREKEKEEILSILKFKPQLINFIYGPINSGKTTLITNLIENLPDNYVVFYINLRERTFPSFMEFLNILFYVKPEKGIFKKIMNKLRSYSPDVISDMGHLGKAFGFPIPEETLKKIFSKENPNDAFVYILEIIRNVKKEGRTPVLIIDELQKIGDIKINGHLIYEVFNFFIRLTKELHICHVFALSSDSLFIEKIYNEAILQGRSNYLLVDDFDEETAKNFLEKYGISKEEQEIVWNNFGGKPGYLSDIVNTKFRGKNINKEIQKTLKISKGQIEEIIYALKDENEEMFNGCIDVFEKFKNSDNFDYLNVTKYIRFLVEKNIIFVNSAEKNIKAQSRINLVAIREILKELK